MEQEKQVIFFSDLLFCALYRWKAMVAAMLILALGLGGFQFYKNSKVSTKNLSAEATASIAHTQQQIKTINDNIKSQQEYMANSILMTMDPYNVSKITTDFYVYTDYQIIPGMDYQNPDKSPAALRAYKMLLNTQEALDSFCDATGLPAKYLPELITTEVITNSNDLCITVRCPDMQTAQALTDSIIEYLKKVHTEVQTGIATHETSVITSISNSPVDLDLAKEQADAALRLTTLRQSLQDANTELKALRNIASDAKATSPIVMAMLGAILGIILVGGWAVLCHLTTDKVYSGRVLENRTGIRILGAVPAAGKHRFLRKLEGRATEPAMDVIAMNILNYCGEHKKLLCLGSWSQDRKEELDAALKELGIIPSFAGSPLTDKDALKQLPSHEAVVLLGICGESRYTNTEKEMQLVADQNKALLGCVLCGG